LIEEALRVARPVLGVAHPRLLVYMANHARLQIMRREPRRAEPTLRYVLDRRERLYPPQDWHIAQVRSLLGASLLAQRRFAEAEPLLLAAAPSLKPMPGPQGREATDNSVRLALLYSAWRRR